MNPIPQPNKVTPAFLALIGTVLSLTVATGGLSLWLAGIASPTLQQQRLFELSSLLFQSGSGCLFGMLGTKANDLLDESSE